MVNKTFDRLAFLDILLLLADLFSELLWLSATKFLAQFLKDSLQVVENWPIGNASLNLLHLLLRRLSFVT